MAKGKTVLDRIKRLEEERQQILAEAKGEALATANEAVKALNALGFNYRLTERGGANLGQAESRKGTRQANPDRRCPICGFQTIPPHDARAHRGQAEKRAFTAEELSARGMRRA